MGGDCPNRKFSGLLATKSATARVCNAIIRHEEVLKRDPERQKTYVRRRGLRPIVVFGGTSMVPETS